MLKPKQRLELAHDILNSDGACESSSDELVDKIIKALDSYAKDNKKILKHKLSDIIEYAKEGHNLEISGKVFLDLLNQRAKDILDKVVPERMNRHQDSFDYIEGYNLAISDTKQNIKNLNI